MQFDKIAGSYFAIPHSISTIELSIFTRKTKSKFSSCHFHVSSGPCTETLMGSGKTLPKNWTLGTVNLRRLYRATAYQKSHNAQYDKSRPSPLRGQNHQSNPTSPTERDLCDFGG